MPSIWDYVEVVLQVDNGEESLELTEKALSEGAIVALYTELPEHKALDFDLMKETPSISLLDTTATRVVVTDKDGNEIVMGMLTFSMTLKIVEGEPMKPV